MSNLNFPAIELATVAATDPTHASQPPRKHTFTRLLAADESGLPMTFAIGLAVLVAGFISLALSMTESTWSYEFLFRRGFVQWVLLGAFTVGFIHLIRRVPGWYREKKALRALRFTGHPGQGVTLVQRRWLQIQALAGSQRGQNRQAAKSLADHDEAEVDAAYRLVSDIVQVLPLIGFFGTVFGLSKGLYQSFLASGGATTKDFAKAIAIAFDNTLLGLGLTIILFIFVSLLRKREDSLLLQLNLLAESWLPDKGVAETAEPEATIAHLLQAVKDLEGHLITTLTTNPDNPVNRLREVIRRRKDQGVEVAESATQALQSRAS